MALLDPASDESAIGRDIAVGDDLGMENAMPHGLDIEPGTLFRSRHIGGQPGRG